MYKKFGKTKDWKRVLGPFIVVICFFSVPISVFLIYIAVESKEVGSFVAAITMSFFVWAFPLQHLRNLYVFPLLEIDDNFVVVNQILQKRAVYTLKQITKVRPLFKSVLFIHNGFPVLLNMNSLTESDRLNVINILKAANKSLNQIGAKDGDFPQF